MNLVNISLIGNRVTGPIPRELGNISTLANLTLEYNQLSGSIPPEFGNLRNIEKLTLNSNNLTGELPATLGTLTTLTDFRIVDNNLTRSIPNFIQQWTNIQRLMIQGSGLSGPIPPGISSLTNLTDLRISDLTGNDSTFPSISNLTKLTILILRSCNIMGQILEFVGSLTKLKLLDLSFNKLSGPIPDSIQAKGKDFIYLTGNSLDGIVPPWTLQAGEVIDLSYNNFSSENPEPSCMLRAMDLFASSKGNTTGIVPCIKSLHCTTNYTSLHINCGGSLASDGNLFYKGDTSSGGPSNAFISNTINANWAFSSTGNFLDESIVRDTFILQNSSSIIGPNPQLYMDARLSPLSLTYYGFCLQNGNYNVSLHFAEIRFTDDRTYSSLGRRIFDIYVQGNLVKKDFNIKDEAGGVNIGIIRNFSAIITDNTLDIQFYWAGKGTNGIPVRGVYGPLISAISVNPKFHILPSNGNDISTGAVPEFHIQSPNGNNISTGAVIGIVVGVISGTMLCLVIVILWWLGCFKRKDTLEYELRGIDLQTMSFSLRKIKAATDDFDSANKIGEGGFGPVYKIKSRLLVQHEYICEVFGLTFVVLEGSPVRWYCHCCKDALCQIEARKS